MFDQTWNFTEKEEGQFIGVKGEWISDHGNISVYRTDEEAPGYILYEPYTITFDPEVELEPKSDGGRIPTGTVEDIEQFKCKVKNHFEEKVEAPEEL